MKYELRILSDDPAELIRLLSGTSFSPLAGTFPTPVANGEGDDETGPVATIAPGEVDKDGVPWDERIHAATKGKTAEGVWRRKRNIPDDFYTKLSAELKARGATLTAPVAVVASPIPVAAPAPAPMPSPTPVPVATAPTAAVPIPTPAPAAPAPAPAPAPVAAPIPTPVPETAPVAEAAPEIDFAKLMQIVGLGVQSGKIDPPYLAWLGETYGFGANIGALATMPAVVPTVYAQLQVDNRL